MQDAFVAGASNAGPSARASARRPEILCLTSLRSFAALEVVLLHTLFELGGDSARALPTIVVALLTRGGAAVSFFFVLSGFILAYTYGDESGMRGTPRRFWRARFARIYPLYALGFLLDAPRVVSFFVSSTGSLGLAVGKLVVAAVAYLALLQSWHPRVTNTWNTPGWSLSTEAFFYAVFPTLQTRTRRWPLSVVFATVFALWAASILAYVLLGHSRMVDANQPAFQTFWRSFPPLHLAEFALGVATGRLFLEWPRAGRERGLHAAGLGAALLVGLLSARPGLVPGALEMNVLAPLFAVIVLALASGALPIFGWLGGSLPVLLGRASYAVYILHQPFKTLFMAVAQRAGWASPSPALLLAYLVSLELTCVALFLYVEDPVRRWITRRAT